MKLILLIAILLFGLLLTPVLGILLIMLFQGVGFQAATTSMMNEVEGLRLMQGIQTVCVFVLPSFLFCRFIRKPSSSFLSIKKARVDDFFIVFVGVLASIPLINLLTIWNEGLQLPEWMSGIEQWMRINEDNAAYATKVLTSGNTLGDYLSCFLVVAVLAGLGEELLFRGVLQSLFVEFFDQKNKHFVPEPPSSSYLYVSSQKKYEISHKSIVASIWLTAFLFSAIHFQFYGFVPRMLMGAWFGYLLWWTGSIWIPIFAHFVNNALSLSLVFAENLGWIEPNVGNEIGTGSSWWLSLVSIFVLALSVLYYLVRDKKR